MFCGFCCVGDVGVDTDDDSVNVGNTFAIVVHIGVGKPTMAALLSDRGCSLLLLSIKLPTFVVIELIEFFFIHELTSFIVLSFGLSTVKDVIGVPH